MSRLSQVLAVALLLTGYGVTEAGCYRVRCCRVVRCRVVRCRPVRVVRICRPRCRPISHSHHSHHISSGAVIHGSSGIIIEGGTQNQATAPSPEVITEEGNAAPTPKLIPKKDGDNQNEDNKDGDNQNEDNQNEDNQNEDKA